MSEPIQSISQGNYILQGTVATSAGIVGDGSTQNPLRADETVLWSGDEAISTSNTISLSEDIKHFDTIRILYRNNDGYRSSTEVIPQPSTGTNLLAGLSIVTPLSNGNAYLKSLSVWISSDGKTLSTPTNSQQLRWPVSGNSPTFTVSQSTNNIYIQRVIGINRISANNA